MSLRLTVENIKPIGPGVWVTSLTPAEIRSLGDAKLRSGQRSVVGAFAPILNSDESSLLIDPSGMTILNVGTSDETIIIDLGKEAVGSESVISRAQTQSNGLDHPTGIGDRAFIVECKRHLDEALVRMAEHLLVELRNRYPGELREGLARKWVNYPSNFVALTIQNRDQSFAVHVKGEPRDFDAPTLEIKPDRGSYCRFKLARQTQFDDALQVILASARRSES